MSTDLPPLQGLDLNLLVALRALLREQSVTRAAVALRSTQPTISRALKTLRIAFQDPLLVRAGRGMALTPLAEQLRTPVERALSAVDRLAQLGSFDPSTAERSFRLVMPDVISTRMMGRLAEALQEAPGVRLQVIGSERYALRGLLDDTVDLVYGGATIEHPELYTRQVGEPMRMQVLYGPRHPCGSTGMSPEAWLRSDHVQLVPGEQPTVQSGFDRALSQAGLHRRIRIHVSYLAAIAPILESSCFVASLPGPAAAWVVQGRDLRAEPHPFAELLDASSPRARLTWHHSHHKDAGHRWLRELMASLASQA